MNKRAEGTDRTGENERDDLPRIDRRDALAALGAVPTALLLGCSSSAQAVAATDAGPSPEAASRDGAGSTADAADAATVAPEAAGGDAEACAEIPTETAGPYPDIDGMISDTKYQRVDITEGKTGTPVSLTLQVVNVASGCAPVAGARVIIWHCDANGVYSEYASSMNADPAQNDVGSTCTTYLRGWQETDATGTVKFSTIYPGWYTPRVTHIHVMVYDPSDLSAPVKTTQFAFPDAVSAAVYGQGSLYPKGQNATTNATDMVFAGSVDNLVAAVTGSPTAGYAVTLPIGLASY